MSSDGVWGASGSGVGVRGESTSNAGVHAITNSGGTALYAERTANGNKGWFGGLNEGGWAESPSGDGFIAKAFAANKSGIYCENTNTNGNAIYANGKGYFEGGISVPVITIRGGADLAEPFDAASSPTNEQSAGTLASPGMLVVIDASDPGKLVVSSESYDTKVAGVISGANGLAPGLTLRAVDHEHADGDHAVAMTGRVWCFVDASYGAITPGDRLTTSPTPGHAMKVSDDTRAPGSVVGKAMTPIDLPPSSIPKSIKDLTPVLAAGGPTMRSGGRPGSGRGDARGDCFRCWRSVSQCRVRADGVVVPAPLFDQYLRLLDRVEDVAVEQFIAQFAVETLNVAILPRTARLNEQRLHADTRWQPSHNEDLAKKLAAMGLPCFGCTPQRLPELLAGAIKGHDPRALAAKIQITSTPK